jgi:hypothetical protein
MPGNEGFRIPDPPSVDISRCTSVPDEVIEEINSSLVVGEAIKIGGPSIDAQGRDIDDSYWVRLDSVVLSDWQAVDTPTGHEPAGRWIGAKSVGVHSFSPDGNTEWKQLNSFSAWVMFFRQDGADRRDRIGIIWDDTHGYRVRMTMLSIVGSAVPEDADSIASLEKCLGSPGQPGPWGFDAPWIWNVPWLEFSTDPVRQPDRPPISGNMRSLPTVSASAYVPIWAGR